MSSLRRVLLATTGAGVAGAATYLGLVTGAAPLDLGIGRRTRPLGPLRIEIAAPPETVFDAITAPYGERVPRALQEKVQVLDRGEDMVLAAHYTPIRGRLRATTVETVRFDRPGRVDFRLVRGPVPQVQETFDLDAVDGGTTLTYTGELGTDLWGLGQAWGNLVATKWIATVQASLDTIKTESERRARR
ncbi:SRPBCC family protein [Kribbella qitaiheensis]|uniref:SRPBCC family protein n=1 Tax=Kribbella qitaiheensis TaxID=1544730 RepID=A0A7G6X546_9ACTN|nr:SRPBCC family protein [Kribbella qitaiheensis]QNE21361.1 SRPBCC family protein [Kribbella qitaiheensis]